MDMQIDQAGQKILVRREFSELTRFTGGVTYVPERVIVMLNNIHNGTATVDTEQRVGKVGHIFL